MWEYSQLGRIILRQLTSLELKYHASNVMPTVSEFHVFSDNPGLLSLAIVGWGPILLSEDPGNIPSPRSLELPFLNRFHLGIIDTDYAKSLFSLFHFPSLEELDLEDISKIVNPGEAQDTTPLFEWLAGTYDGSEAPFPMHRIRILNLDSIDSNSFVFTRFLSQFSSLNALRFYNMPEEYLLSLRRHPASEVERLWLNSTTDHQGFHRTCAEFSPIPQFLPQ